MAIYRKYDQGTVIEAARHLNLECEGVHWLVLDQSGAVAKEPRSCVMPNDPASYARALYAELHRCDLEGAALIAIEAVPDTAQWRAIQDRPRRAAA